MFSLYGCRAWRPGHMRWLLKSRVLPHRGIDLTGLMTAVTNHAASAPPSRRRTQWVPDSVIRNPKPKQIMKTSSIHRRSLIVCTLLIGMVSAVPAADSGFGNKASQFAPQVEKRAGFFSRLFGNGSRTSKRPDRDDDDDDHRARDDDDNHSPRTVPLRRELPAPQPRTFGITTTSTTRASADPHNVDAHRIPLVQMPAPTVASPKPQAAAPARQIKPRDVPSRATESTEVRIENTMTSPPPPVAIRTVITPAQPVGPAPSASAPNPLTGATAAPSQSAAVSMAEKPASPPPPPFGKPVPGRSGMVYPPGVKETTENMLDVRDIAPGTKVRDPVTKTIFLVP